MDRNECQQIIALLLDVKHILQRRQAPETNKLLQKIDKCISKVIPYVNTENSKIDNDSVLFPMGQSKRSQSVIVSRSSENEEFNSEQFILFRKSADEEILKVQNSFAFQESNVAVQTRMGEMEVPVLHDYFVLRYNLAYNDYEVYGRKGPSTDRKVFVDLLTYDNKRSHIKKLEKSESMTSILREVFSQSKPGQPFILPNYQEDRTKYLFVFSLPECASIAKEYYRTETMCCFASHEFILGELTQLMSQISKVIFEQQVNEASQVEDVYLSEAISLLHGKKTYKSMEKVIENYLQKRHSVTKSKLFRTKLEKPLINCVEDYLQNCSELWSLVKRGKQQQLIITLVLLYYLALSEYKIVLLATSNNRHLISELILGLTRALHPLTYVYPIVGTSITPHHFEFANSPVPILVGFWGSQRDYNAAKSSLKKVIKSQKQMSSSELASQTLLAVVDLEDHSLQFLDSAYSQTCRICKSIQTYIEGQTAELTSVKLSYLTSRLMDGCRQQQWMPTLTKSIQVTQMYDFFRYRK